MRLINIDPIPNQSFSVQLDENLWNFSLKYCGSIMAADISLNNEILLQGSRVIAGGLLLPYKYQEAGNFLILTANDELPNYLQFGNTQFLIYITQLELEALRG
jgi:hypothetical protein